MPAKMEAATMTVWKLLSAQVYRRPAKKVAARKAQTLQKPRTAWRVERRLEGQSSAARVRSPTRSIKRPKPRTK